MPRFTPPPIPGGGGMPGGFVPPAPPRFPGGCPGACRAEGGLRRETGPVDRGYLITLQLTSPNRNAPAWSTRRW